jgi:hypothetical protein
VIRTKLPAMFYQLELIKLGTVLYFGIIANEEKED